MAIENQAATMAQGGVRKWIDRLVNAKEGIAVLKTNQADLAATAAQAKHTLNWQVDQWNGGYRSAEVSQRAEYLRRWWDVAGEDVHALNRMVKPAPASADLGALVAEPTHSAEEAALKAEVLTAHGELAGLSNKQTALKAAIGSLESTEEGNMTRWNREYKSFNTEQRKNAYLGHWEGLKTGLYQVASMLGV